MTEVSLHKPSEFGREEWLDLQTLYRDALFSTIDRSLAEIDALAGMDEPRRYFTSHGDPNTEVGPGRRYLPDQSYTKPRVAIATDAGEVVGFMYAADNVSWSIRNKLHLPTSVLGIDLTAIDRHEEKRKLEGTTKRYLWLREVAVRQDHQRQGLLRDLGRVILASADEDQPVSTYLWPDEIPFLQSVAEAAGFVPTGNRSVSIFGEGSPNTSQVRMQAPSVRTVNDRL